MHEANSFLTLTYEDEFLPDDYSVSRRELQLFMKRLRRLLEPKEVRFMGCGEYGSLKGRPHYHVLLFGHDFAEDRKRWRYDFNLGYNIYISDTLKAAWPYGFHEIGELNARSARYVAGYIQKRVRGSKADEHYTREHPFNGTINRVEPEFLLMSRRPGLGAAWFDQYKGDAFPSDFLILDGAKRKVPEYYLRKLPEDEQAKYKEQRRVAAKEHADNNTERRLITRHESGFLRHQRSQRKLEDEI